MMAIFFSKATARGVIIVRVMTEIRKPKLRLLFGACCPMGTVIMWLKLS